jgi:hypothetical protein
VVVVVVPMTEGSVETLVCLVVGEVVVFPPEPDLPPEVDDVEDFVEGFVDLLGGLETLVMMMLVLGLVVLGGAVDVVVCGAVDEGVVVAGVLGCVGSVVVVADTSANAG